MSDLHKVCTLLDKLTLDTLQLIEEQIQTKINLENAMNDGELHLARSRYILGRNNVSATQLPTENDHYEASSVVVTQEEDPSPDGSIPRTLEISKPEDQSVDPIKLFGYLVPQDLRRAQDAFKRALQWVVQVTNVQNRLDRTCTCLEQLKDYKHRILEKTETIG